MRHIDRKHEQLLHPFISLVWLIFDLRIAQYCEMFIEKCMVLLKNPFKLSWLYFAKDHIVKVSKTVSGGTKV